MMLSLVVPVYYEEDCILQFLKETKEVLSSLDIDYEYVFIDDGSKDNTVQLIKTAALKDTRIKLLELSYNHGKQAAVTAGIHHAAGDYMIYMDPDLQDPPEEIPRFLEEIKKGYDLVLGIREEKVDSIINKMFSKIFWTTLSKFTGLDIPKGIAVMRMFNRSFADEFLKYKEQNRFIEGIFINISMKRSQLTIKQRARFAGKSKFNFRKKMQLAFDAIFDFSEIPLRLSLQLGFFFVLLGFLSLVLILLLKLFMYNFQAGWPSVIGTLIFGNGLLLFFMGISAIYIGRIYKESKNRPLYSIKDKTNIQ